jgi:hypothetical protein
MVLRTVILPGVDPADILRRNMNMSLLMAACPLFLFITSEVLSGSFSGFTSKGPNLLELIALGFALICYLVGFPVGFVIQTRGVYEISDYLVRNRQILERQLMGALARVFRVSQIYSMSFLLTGTSIGLIDLSVNRSQAGLIVYLIGQAAMIYAIPWPARCETWLEVKRRQVLS